jgi:FecR protein
VLVLIEDTMAFWRFTGFGSSFVAFLMGTSASIPDAGAQNAGTVGAVNSNANSQQPGGGSREVSVGQGVVQNERITTNATGTVQIMFNDRSALNVGRSASVVIDKFVYNPASGAGEMAVSMARGAARFVGGQVSHTSGATVKTPAATIGVRGGNITLSHLGGVTTVMVHNGVATVTTSRGQVTLRTGQQISVSQEGTLATITPIDMAQLRTLTRELSSRGAQAGGAVRLPTGGQAARVNVGNGRPTVQSPNFDLPAAGDDLVRGFAASKNQPYP